MARAHQRRNIAGLGDNHFARAQSLIERDEFSRVMRLGSDDRENRQIAVADRLQNFVAVRRSNFAGGGAARTEQRDSGRQRESKNKEQQLEFHSVSPQVCRDTPGVQGSNPPGASFFPTLIFSERQKSSFLRLKNW